MVKIKTNTQVISEFKQIHGDKYDYSQVFYTKAREYVSIICPVHGMFEQSPNSHLRGAGCYECGLIKTGLKKRLTNSEFIEKSNIVHNNFFKYDKVEYKTYYDNVIITCPIHGDFTQTPRKHLGGNKCKKCRSESYYIDFIDICEKKYTGYTYDKVKYMGLYKHVIITCVVHGDFVTKAGNFLRGILCKKCVDRTTSKPEQKWLDELNVDISNRNQYLKIENKTFCVDGLDIDKKIIYEFYGDFFHGNPDVYESDKINPLTKEKFGDLYKKTMEKEEFLIKNGYTIISIWEKQYKENKK